MTRAKALAMIFAERERQKQLKADGSIPFNCDEAVLAERKVSVLTEEVGEVATAVNDLDQEGLIKELVQVAAVALAWLESESLWI